MGIQKPHKMFREEEKLCLKWNDFQDNAISAFGTLREDREFSDVTLACEDGHQVEAHKVILASGSPFFLNLLRRNKHSHPLIYMRGLKSEDLGAMIDFLYYGEANIDQENLDSFLAVAEELQLKGFRGSCTEERVEEMKPTLQRKAPKPVQKRSVTKQEATDPDVSNVVEKVETLSPLEGTVAVTDFTVAADLQDLDAKIKSMMEFSENKAGGNQGRARICKVCGKEGTSTNISKHIEAHHITGISHTCNVCGLVAKTKASLYKHTRRIHAQE